MKVLVVVDMQKDFVDGALGSTEAQAIVSNVCNKIKAFDGVFAVTFDTHQEDYLNTQEGSKLPVAHCIKGTEGWKLDCSVAAALEERMTVNKCESHVFYKPTFGSVELAEKLVELHSKEPIEEIVLIGLCTDICVISNAMLIKAFLPEIKITVDASCCSGVTPDSHQNALNAMKMCQINIENEFIKNKGNG